MGYFIINFIVHNHTQKIIVRAYKGNYHKFSRCPIRKTLLSSCETFIISLGLRLFYVIEFLVGIYLNKAFFDVLIICLCCCSLNEQSPKFSP